MKKLSALIAMILCVTIGGVYATWSYGNIDAAIQHDVNLSVGMDYTFSGAVGSYSIEMTDTLTAFKVDQEAENDYDAVLRANGNIYLVFTPNANSTDDINANGIDTYFYFTDGDALANYKYGNTQIFEYVDGNGAANALKIGKIGSTDQTCDGVFSKITIGGNEKIACDITQLLLTSIKIGTFSLPTYDDFDDFKGCLTHEGAALSFSLRITNIKPNA
ncbi:MAG: hypothetical protein E7369_00540 [Clostridiales bacterium]|nr:hypothetical protein [Clostridiales bacterium]